MASSNRPQALKPVAFSPQQAPQATNPAYAALFCCARIFAHRAFCVAAIFLRAAADMVRFAGAELVVFATATAGCDCFRTLAHRFLCASAILRREAAEIIRLGWVTLLDTAEPFADDPFKDSIPEIIWSNFSISICALLRFSRSSLSAFSKLDIFFPRDFQRRPIV